MPSMKDRGVSVIGLRPFMTVFKYSTNRLRRPKKCSALRKFPGKISSKRLSGIPMMNQNDNSKPEPIRMSVKERF